MEILTVKDFETIKYARLVEVNPGEIMDVQYGGADYEIAVAISGSGTLLHRENNVQLNAGDKHRVDGPGLITLTASLTGRLVVQLFGVSVKTDTGLEP